MAGEDELMLLERVFLRIGSADTDEQLQVALGRFLPPVLLKLASPTDGVRKKVMELLVHINKRVKSRPLIQLPVKDLLLQYMDPSASPFVTNFSILYIKMGFPRLEPSVQAELVPQLVMCIAGRPEPQQHSLLQLMMPALQYVKLPSDMAKKRAVFNLEDKPQVARLILEFMMDLLVLPYSFAAHQLKSQAKTAQPSAGGSNGQSSGGGSAQAKPASTFTGPPPAMSEAAFKRVTGESLSTPEELEKIKLGIIELLSLDVFPEEDVICHLIVGTADTRHSVATAADKHLKRIAGSQDWNKAAILSKLFSIFQGTIVVKGKASTVKPEHKKTPASVQLRLKIFPYFLKSREATNHFPSSIQVVFDCLYGANTNLKLKHMAVQFIHHLCLHCVDVKFNPIASVLMSGMVKLVGETKDPPDSKLKSLAYAAIGKIGARVPQMVCGDIALLQTLFDSVCKEEADCRLAVQEALSMMAGSFKKIDLANAKLVEALIMHSIEKPEPQARMAAVQYAKAVFSPDHMPSRYVLLLACGDMNEDIYSEASKALREVQKCSSTSDSADASSTEEKKKAKLMPVFTDMVQYVQEKAAGRVKTNKKYVTGNSVLAFNPAMYGETLVYLRMCLAYSAGVMPNLESMSTMQEQAPYISKYVAGLVGKQDDKGPISLYIGIIRQLLTAIGGAPAMYCLLEVVAVARETLAPQFVKHLDWIKNFMFSSREDMRIHASELYALVVATGETAKRHSEVIRELTSNLQSQAFEGQHGSLLCLGYLIGYLLASHRARSSQVTLEDMEVDHTSDDKKVVDAIAKAVVQIAGLLDSGQAQLSLGACSAFGEIGRCGAVPLANKSSEKDKGRPSKLSIVEKLVAKVQSAKENAKVREKACVTLGNLCVGERRFPHRQKVIEGLMDAAAAKQFELHFTIGEALVCAAQGPSSSAGRDLWTVTEKEFQPQKQADGKPDEVGTLLKLLLEKYVPSPNPHIKQAACIWLVALVRKCGDSPLVQKRLRDVQSAFMDLLSQNDEITQDIASKGLGLVYEKCSKEQKQSLVSTLVGTLTSGRRATEKMTRDTQVFSEGALGQTPEGQSLSTYKELCSIANDLNQPDLIYKFMHLANHNAVWNSKKGAAFGFGTIAAQAGEQLAPYLHQIVPRLYRYQFDPNPRIQQAMSSIWSALVPETNKTVDKYLKEISEDLIKNLTSNQWRVRESSCMAVNDMLRGRPLDDIVDQLPTLWEVLFRVRDDIKESVRNAADTALKTLSRVSIKVCDPNYGKVGSHATSQVLPVLVKTGLNSQVQEVRAVSLATILKISRTAGQLLKPHIPLLVTALLESLSTLEPQYLNYVSLHVTSSQAAQNKLDNARVAASKTSPMMETVNMCVQYVDESVLPELIPRIIDLLKSGVGLGTKTGCANLIISLTHQCPHDLVPYAGKLLNALLNGLHDRNMTVKKSCASAIGHVVKIAKDNSVEKLINKLKTWYLEKEEESVRSACGVALHAIGHRSPDVMKRHAAVALPLAFFAMHEQSDKKENSSDVNSTWEEVWLDATPGTEGGIRLYLPEIVTLGQRGLESQSWPTKAQAARAMKTVASKLGGQLGPPHLGTLLTALLAGLKSRTWTGKETLLLAVLEICLSCKDALSTAVEGQPSVEQTIVPALLTECKRQNVAYKTEALRCTGAILQAYSIDCFSTIANVVLLALEKSEDKAVDAEVDQNTMLQYKSCAYECLGESWPQVQATQVEYQARLFDVLCESLANTTWKLEVSALKALSNFLARLVALQDDKNIESQNVWLTDMCQRLVTALCNSLGNVKYLAVRAEAVTVTEALVNRLHRASKLDVLGSTATEQLTGSLQDLASAATTSPEICDRAQSLLKQLQKTAPSS